jgi:hypothetical protein
MQFYHGSKSNFDTFNKKGSGKHGPRYYFTPDRNEAIAFAKTLSGISNDGQFLYTVHLKCSNSFNTMNKEHCNIVARHLNTSYKAPEFVGGAKEHYHHLLSQLKRKGLIDSDFDLNDRIQDSGFDSIFYDLMEHVIVFDEKQIELIKKEEII